MATIITIRIARKSGAPIPMVSGRGAIPGIALPGLIPRACQSSNAQQAAASTSSMPRISARCRATDGAGEVATDIVPRGEPPTLALGAAPGDRGVVPVLSGIVPAHAIVFPRASILADGHREAGERERVRVRRHDLRVRHDAQCWTHGKVHDTG